MTSIKPPAGTISPAIPGIAEQEGASGPSSVAGVGSSSSPSEAQGAARTDAPSSAGGAGGTDAIAELAAALGRGEVSATQAAEQLVQRAVGGVSAHLSEAERAELTAVLIAAFEGDPALRGALG